MLFEKQQLKQCVGNERKKLRAAMAALTKNSGWFLISYDVIAVGGGG